MRKFYAKVRSVNKVGLRSIFVLSFFSEFVYNIYQLDFRSGSFYYILVRHIRLLVVRQSGFFEGMNGGEGTYNF